MTSVHYTVKLACNYKTFLTESTISSNQKQDSVYWEICRHSATFGNFVTALLKIFFLQNFSYIAINHFKCNQNKP